MLRPPLGAVCLLLLSACTASAPSPLPDVPTGVPPLTLTCWHTQTGNDAALLATLAADFHAAYPSITVKSEAKKDQGDLLRQGIAALAMNQLPDLVIADRRTIAEFARQNALVALDSLFDDPTLGLAANDRADFLPGLLDAGRFPDLKNQLFALPFDENAVVFYYNLDLLKSAKLDPPRTWDLFGAAARATTKGSAHGWVMAPTAPIFYAFLVSRGSRALNDDQTRAAFNDAGGTKMLQLIAALNKGGSAYLVDSADTARADFAQGKAALLFDTTDDLAVVSSALTRVGNTFRWGVAGIPQDDPAHPLTAIDGSSIAVFNSSPDRTRAAWLFARWLVEPAQTARWSRATLSIPLRTSALPILASNTPDPLFQRLRDGFGDALPSGRPLPAVKDAAQIDAAMVEMWISVANGTDPAAALSRATSRVTRILGP